MTSPGRLARAPQTEIAGARRTRRRVAGILLVTGPVIFLLAEFITAAFWTDPGYSYTYDFISNLGVQGPSTLFGQYMSSPVAWLMNIGFGLFGIVILAGVALLPELTGRRRITAVGLAVVLALGGVVIGIFPGSAEALQDGTGEYHSMAAFAAFISANVLAILLGRMHRRLALSTGIGRALVIVGVIGILSAVLYFWLLVSSIGDGGPVLGIIGLIERGATHPFLIALLCAGVAIASSRARSVSA